MYQLHDKAFYTKFQNLHENKNEKRHKCTVRAVMDRSAINGHQTEHRRNT